MPQAQATQAAYFRSLILYEDNHLLLVYKPSGMPSQNDKSCDPSLLDYGKAYLIDNYCKPGNAYLSLPHRLDRPVSGLCVMAKTTKAMQRLSVAFQQKHCKKFYLAIVERPIATQQGFVPKDFVAKDFVAIGANWQKQTDYIRKESRNNKAYITQADAPHNAPRAKLATLQYRLMATGKNYSIMAVKLETGRHHQIRCQLAALGYPIQGDVKYGAKKSNKNGGISLYAFALQVPMPVQNKQMAASKNNDKTFYLKQFVWQTEQKDSSPQQSLQSICLPWEWHGDWT